MKTRMALALVLCFTANGKEQAINHDSVSITVNEDSFYVAGYSIRTSNADELSGHGRIGLLWQRFRHDDLGARIPHRVDRALIVVYSHYASDETGDFTYLLGARVSSLDHLPRGLGYRKVAAGRYAVFTTAIGPVVEVIREQWKRIWKTEPADMGGRRAFLTDYEVYDERTADPRRAQAEIHIGLKVDAQPGRSRGTN